MQPGCLTKAVTRPEVKEPDLGIRDQQTGIESQRHTPGFASLPGVGVGFSVSGAGYRAFVDRPRLRARHTARGGAGIFAPHRWP